VDIQIDWGDQDETIMVMKLPQHWDATDYYMACDRLRQMAQTHPGPLVLVVDTRASLAWPEGNLTLFRHALRNRNGQMSGVVIIVRSEYIPRTVQMLPDYATSGAQHWMRFTKTVDEAYARVDQMLSTAASTA